MQRISHLLCLLLRSVQIGVLIQSNSNSISTSILLSLLGTKRHWLSFPENIYLVFVLINVLFFFSTGASTISGFFAAACSLPFDYVKTQIQKMQPDAEGKLPYFVSLDCALKTLRSGGPLKFYTGFPVYCVRIAPHVMVLSLSVSLYVCAFTYWCQSFILTCFFFFWVLARY